MLDRETHAAAPTFGEPPNLRHGRLQLLPQTYAAAPTYADLRGSPDLLTQQVWANVFLEEAEEEVEYRRDEGKVEEESEEED